MSDLIIKRNKDGKPFFRLNKKTKRGSYSIFPQYGQFKYCERVTLNGFDRLPTGFYTNDGIGLTGAGYVLLQQTSDKYGKKVDLSIVASGKPKFDARGKKVSVTIPHNDLIDINADVRSTKRTRNAEVRSEVLGFLGRHYPSQFKGFRKMSPQYSGGTLAKLLKRPDVTGKLDVDDRTELEEFIPEYLSTIKGTLRAKKKLQVIFESLDAGKKIYLEKVIKEFQSKLKNKVQNEAVWQEFLSEHILMLRNNYGEVLEKESVSLKGKFPDFMLLDPYSYLDIYEIKKPSTRLLRLDKSRNNFYWDVEIAKAISQVENYLHQVQRHSDALINDIRRNKGIEISIVRPQGYIVAGLRTELTSLKMKDDFRILSEALKNIDIVLYDDLLNNLKSFVKKIGNQ
jgi:hypothetical protein